MWLLLSNFILNYFGTIWTSSTVQPSRLLLCPALHLEGMEKLVSGVKRNRFLLMDY